MTKYFFIFLFLPLASFSMAIYSRTSSDKKVLSGALSRDQNDEPENEIRIACPDDDRH